MSNNKLTSISPTLSLGVGPATFSLTTSNLSTLTSPTQPMGASPLNPTQSLGASPLTAQTLNLSASTINALNALNNPTQTLNTLNNPSQAIAALNPPAQTLNTLNGQTGSPSSQPFLASQPMTGIVSLPQNFCFPSAQTSASGANQTAALGVTLGFPMAAAAALTSNNVSLNTNSIPLNSSTIPLNTNTIPLNSNTIPLNTGNPISQQLVQSLSMGQQPAIASLQQGLNFPLGQALLGMSNTAGASGGPFLSTNLGQFPGLPSVIMGSQQSVLQGTLMGTTPGQSAQLQTLNPQPLSFPFSTGPVVTELPPTSQPSQQVLPPVSKSQESLTYSGLQVSQQTQVSTEQPESQTATNQQGSVTQPIVLDSVHESHTPDVQNQPHSPSPSESLEKSQIHTVEEDSEQPPTSSELQEESPQLLEEQSGKTVNQELSASSDSAELAAQSPQQAEGESSSPGPEPQEQENTVESPSSAKMAQLVVEQASCELKDVELEQHCVESVDVAEKKDDDSNAQSCMVEEVLEIQTSKLVNEKPIEDSSEVNACVEDIKQEAVESEEMSSPPHSDCAAVNSGSGSPPMSSSPVKVEATTELVDCSVPSTSQDLCRAEETSEPVLPIQVGVTSYPVYRLLSAVKREAMEVEEEEEMALQESTPGSEDSLDSYYHRQCHSPSPMASLQLTRADTTSVTTTTAAANVTRRLEDGEGIVDIKLPIGTDTTLMDMEEPEFVWEDYLQETGATSVPPIAFKHVECREQSGLSKGMRVEVANKSQPGTYWVSSVILTCGPLLRLRYEGYEEDGSEDFWCDLTACEIHPIGWCAENGVALCPPDGLKNKYNDWAAKLQEILKTVPAAPSYLLDKRTGTSPFDQLKQGMRLELQDANWPVHVWLVDIMENVGGRLYLRIEGLDSGVADFWAFYLHELLHPIGWAKERGYSYVAPKLLTQQGLSESEIQNVLECALKEAEDQKLSSDIFKHQQTIREHMFKRGMKLEAVSPNSGNHICPATVIEVIDSYYFVVEMDNLEVQDSEKKIRFCCHSGTPTIFPIQWTVFKGIKLTAPPGWPKPDFNWTDYLNHCRALAAPESCFHLDHEDHEFERGMKLEAVNPENPNQICAATITNIAAHLMWIHLDSSERIIASHVEHVASYNLFPVGWCEINGYQLRPPRRTGLNAGPMRRRVAVVQPEMADGSQPRDDENEGRTYCPKIYFNHKCFSGPHLSKGRIAELPCSVGPGPLNLVMKEVLTMLISVAYKSSRVLREIQMDGPPNRAMNQQILKAKYKGKSYRAVVEVCRTTNQLEGYCRQICIKLECCPNLISPHFVGDHCPEQCSRLTKTKYTYYYGKKKRKIGRPPGGHTNLENGPKKPAKRRKRRRLGMVVRKSHLGNGEDTKEEEEEGDDKMSETSDTPTADSSSSTAMPRLPDHRPHSTTATAAASKRLKRKYTHHIPPPSEIRTRGAKLPRYSFERRTHKKILLSPIPSGGSGQRTKSIQVNKPAKFRSPSPEPCRPQSLSSGNTLTSRSNASPLSIICPPHGLSVPCSNNTLGLLPPCSPLPLEKNPLHWTVSDTVEFIKTTDCAHVAKIFREQEIDGQALLLLSLPTVQDHLDLKLGPAIKLCHEIQRVKLAYYSQFDTTLSNNV